MNLQRENFVCFLQSKILKSRSCCPDLSCILLARNHTPCIPYIKNGKSCILQNPIVHPQSCKMLSEIFINIRALLAEILLVFTAGPSKSRGSKGSYHGAQGFQGPGKIYNAVFLCFQYFSRNVSRCTGHLHSKLIRRAFASKSSVLPVNLRVWSKGKGHGPEKFLTLSALQKAPFAPNPQAQSTLDSPDSR